MCLQRFSKTNIPPALPDLKQLLLFKKGEKIILIQLKGKVAKFRHEFWNHLSHQVSGKIKICKQF